MNLLLQEKRALITGGTSGIGRAIAKALLSEGTVVTITGRSEQSVDAALASLQESIPDGEHANATGIVADAATASGIQAITGQLEHADVLVNNLGIYESKQFEQISDADWFSIFETNVLSGTRLSRHYLPRMLASGWGRVIFIASEAAVTIPPDMIHYAATKAALLAISRGLAERTRSTGVTVNTVIPGPTKSPGITSFLRSQSSDPNPTEEEAEAEFFRIRRPASLLQRLIDASEIANLVAYLASPLSSATNGAALRVEGGLIPTIL